MDFPTENDRPGLRELLAFYAEAGVDDALIDETGRPLCSEAKAACNAA